MAEAHLRQGELGRLHRHGDIAAGHQPDAPAEGMALHFRNGRLGQLVQALQHVGEPHGVVEVLVLGVVRHPPHPVQVRARAEAPAVGGQDHDAHGVVVPHPVNRPFEPGDQLVIEGVVHIRAIERQGGDAFTVYIEFKHGVQSGLLRVGAEPAARVEPDASAYSIKRRILHAGTRPTNLD